MISQKKQLQKTDINGWSFEWEYPGYAAWYNDDYSKVYIAATLYYDSEDELSIQCYTTDGKEIESLTIKHDSLGNEEDLKWYINTLKKEFPKLEKLIRK